MWELFSIIAYESQLRVWFIIVYVELENTSADNTTEALLS
jgi:hypothetical protein